MTKTIFANFKFEILLFLIYSTYVVLISGCSENFSEPKEDESQKWNGELVYEVVNAVLKPDSNVWLWGGNYAGTLGNGTTTNSDIPVKALNLESVVSIDFSFGAA